MFRIAWRNIWRNRRRAVITMASVFFAAFFCILLMCFDEGTWMVMIDNTLRTQAGHIQIHGKGYWDDKIVDNFLSMDAAVISGLENIPNVENVSPRVETYAMVSFGSVSKGIAVIGVSPEKEAQKSNLPSRIVQGEYLAETDDGVLIGEGLSNYLKANTGDTLALIGQGYHGASAAQLFVVRGILAMMTTEMDYGMIYTTLLATQQFIDMPNGYSGILISIKDNKLLDKTMKDVSNKLQLMHSGLQENTETHDLKSNDYEVFSWHFTMDRLLQSAESDEVFSLVILYILYVIVGFGILGTVIMMTNERKHEFSMMISLGMPRIKLISVVSFELLVMSLMGLILALMVTMPVAYWFAVHPINLSGEMARMMLDYGMEPILLMSTTSSIFISQIVTVLIISLLAMIYPANKIMKLKLSQNK